MKRPRWSAVALVCGLAWPGGAAAEDTAVARAHLRVAGGTEAAGSVFFLAAPGESGAAAVGAAHSFDLAKLARSGEVEFRLGGGPRVSVSSRYLAPPGRAFHDPGGSLRGDFVVFALDLAPHDVRILEAAAAPPRAGARVRVLGIPSDARRPQADVFGTVASATAERIEVDLDTPADLRGWGGAPVLAADGERVVGILQAAWPSADRLRVGVAPIADVSAAIAAPLEGGLGRPFAAYAPEAAPPQAAAPPEAAPPQRASAPTLPTPPAGAQVSPAAAPPPSEDAASPTPISVEIEIPQADEILGDAAGVFMAGRAHAAGRGAKRYDMVFVLDTSGSTSEPTGVDVDADGQVGGPRLGGLGGIFGLGSTDPGDSILAAEVAAAQRLLTGLDPRATRVGLVTFAGYPSGGGGGMIIGSSRVDRAATTEEPLTSDFARIDRALGRIRERGPEGMTHIAAGVDQATIELLGLKGALSQEDATSEKVVLFFTDGLPTLPYEGFEAHNTRAVLRAAERARRAGVRIHSFAIGPEALSGPITTVEMAAITHGIFTPVRHPGNLVSVVEAVSLVNIENVRVRNATLGQDAFETRSHVDGSWDALVPVAPGKNELEVVARSSQGVESRDTVIVHFAPDAPEAFLPPALVSRRNELLEARLIDLRRGRLDAEREAIETTRRELALEVERERAAANDRAAQQRKELDLEVGQIPAEEPAPPGPKTP